MEKQTAAEKLKSKPFHVELELKGSASRGLQHLSSDHYIFAKTISELKKQISVTLFHFNCSAENWGECKVFENNKLIGYMSFNGEISTKKPAPAKTKAKSNEKVKKLIMKKIASGLKGTAKAKKSMLSKIEIMMPE